MSNELYDGVLVNVLRKRVASCGYWITSLISAAIYSILIMASRMGYVSAVRRLLKDRKTAFGVEYVQKFIWTPNRKNKTAFDVAVENGHVEVAKLLLENVSLECLVSKRNNDGKLVVSMLCNPEHEKFILDTLDNAANAVTHPLAITSITIHEEDLRQGSPQAYINSIMGPKSYPQSHENETWKALEKLDQGEVELTPNKNTILHLVSHIGDIKYARKILVKHPSLVYHRNSKGETPAYIAAREGHVDILAIIINYFRMNNDDIESLVKRTDNHSALHVAIQNHHVAVVFWLIKEVPQLANLVNNFNESPIYLAAERRFYYLLYHMLTKCEAKSFEGPQGKTALHAAAISGSKECIAYLLREEIDQKIRDEHGWTPLRYAVHHNNASATAELVDADPSIVNEIMKEDDINTFAVHHNNASASAELVDADPSIVNEIMIEEDINTFAVHIAASLGYYETLKVLMSHCPGCSELLDGKGRNIFHVAVENKKTEVIELIYRDKSYTSLVNEKDKDGNTPMHLLMASDLEMMEVAMDSRVNINAMNNEKRTPLDMASSSEKRKRLFERVAVSAHKIPCLNKSVWDEKRTAEEFELVEYLLIVATLIATATYAAAFTVPGGFDSNEGSKQQGMPILIRKAAFKAFVYANTSAFASSCSVLGSHILLLVYRLKSHEVDKEDRKSIHTRIVGMYYITGFSLLSMIVAFITGLYVVLSPIRGLAIYLCVLPIWVPVLIMIFFPAIIGSQAHMIIDLLWSFGKRNKRKSA